MSAPEGRSWVLGSEAHRQLVGSKITLSPPGWVVRLDPPRRSILQNRFVHALLTDLAEQLVWPQPPANHGTLHDMEWWKRRCTLQWLLDEKQPVEVITPLQQAAQEQDFGLLLPHTSDLTTAQFASLCDWILAFGSTQGVAFRDPKRPA